MKRDKRDTHAELTYMHHTAHYFPDPERWVIINQAREPVAVITTNTIDHVTELAITLVLGEHKLAPRVLTHPGGMRTALRWVCQELNNGKLWLTARLRLERESRFLGHKEPELLACSHASDYQYCRRLLANLPGLTAWESTQGE